MATAIFDESGHSDLPGYYGVAGWIGSDGVSAFRKWAWSKPWS